MTFKKTLLSLVIILPSMAQADTILYDTEDKPLELINLAYSDADSFISEYSAAQFTLTQKSRLTKVNLFGGYDDLNFKFNGVTAPDNFSVNLYSGNLADTIVANDIGTLISRTNRTNYSLPNSAQTHDVFEYEFDIAAIELEADTNYWLSVFNNTQADTDIAWGWSTSDVLGSSLYSFDLIEWEEDETRFAFSLTGEVIPDVVDVPEPMSLALAALVLLGFRARYKSIK